MIISSVQGRGKDISEAEARAVESGNNEARRRNVTMPRPKHASFRHDDGWQG